MGKNEFLTPKAVRLHGTTFCHFSVTLLLCQLCSWSLPCVLQIGNRIKAKGLQKLRWYCQMCQKQCRDENGFKCHQNSESHKRQMEVFGQNPGKQPAATLALHSALRSSTWCNVLLRAQGKTLTHAAVSCLQQNVQQIPQVSTGTSDQGPWTATLQLSRAGRARQ